METMRMGAVVGLGLPHATICDTTVCKPMLLYILLEYFKV